MRDIFYIIAFMLSVIGVDWLGGHKSAFYYTLLVFFGVLTVNAGKYSIMFQSPEIMTGGSTGGAGRKFTNPTPSRGGSTSGEGAGRNN